jgi:hypothetical protein
MGILLAFAPFVVFAVVDRLVGSSAGLLAGAATSALLIARDFISHHRSPKILEIGTFILFAGLAIYAYVAQPTWSVIGVRLLVDTGLLVIVLASMVIGKPFTLQYARETVDAQYWDRPEFIRTNYVITAAWALAFAVMVAAELALLYLPGMSHRFGVIVIIVALIAAVKFTGWYPERVKKAQ